MTQYQIAILGIAIFNIVGAFLYFPMKKEINRQEELLSVMLKELGEYKLHVAETYVTKNELESHLARIEKSLDEIKNMFKNYMKEQ